MQNHSEKRRDMCRSILPSSARTRARDDLARWKRKHRRQIRANLYDALGYEWDDYEGHVNDDNNRPVDGGSGWDRIITHIVAERRNSDKVGPLVHWARVTNDRLPKDWDDVRRYMFFKALLPDNLIGRHALSHIDNMWDLPWDYNPFRRYYSIETLVERRARWAEEHENWVILVRTVVETRHRMLNERYVGDPCYGLHDVDRWCRMHPARDHQAQVLKIAGATS